MLLLIAAAILTARKLSQGTAASGFRRPLPQFLTHFVGRRTDERDRPPLAYNEQELKFCSRQFSNPMAVPNLLFIDTNIWLDFYRHRNEAALQLLEHIEALADQLIVTYQLETEFKKNRQAAMLEGIQGLKAPASLSRPGIFSDDKDVEVVARNLKDAEARIKNMRLRMIRALEKPGSHDPVYKTCQRLFHKKDELVLNRENNMKKVIRRKAFRRFLHGCPPRKNNDTSLGDAFNWEWMLYCAQKRKTGLVIVSRDGDFGLTLEGKSYVNDHLRQEFSERVSRKRALLLFSHLSEALKHFKIRVSAQEAKAEKEAISNVASPVVTLTGTSETLKNWLQALDTGSPIESFHSTLAVLSGKGGLRAVAHSPTVSAEDTPNDKKPTR